jgi:hypothetical protein
LANENDNFSITIIFRGILTTVIAATRFILEFRLCTRDSIDEECWVVALTSS